MITDDQVAMLKFASRHIGSNDGRVDTAIDQRWGIRPVCFWMRILELARHEDAMSAAPFEVRRIRDFAAQTHRRTA